VTERPGRTDLYLVILAALVGLACLALAYSWVPAP